jgi:hypothetical protein
MFHVPSAMVVLQVPFPAARSTRRCDCLGALVTIVTKEGSTACTLRVLLLELDAIIWCEAMLGSSSRRHLAQS